MKNVSILGCGWLGLELGSLLSQRNFRVKGSVTKVSKTDMLNSAGIIPYVFNWADNNIPSVFFECNVMIVTIPPSVSNYKTNFVNFIRLMERHKVENVLYISATSVYPDTDSEVWEEDADYIISPHSKLALLEIEDLLRYNKKFSTTILRFAGLYGPDRIPGKFLAGKKDVSGGNKPVNLIHRDDCIEIIIQLVEKEVWGETFNACTDGHPNRKDFYIMACRKQKLEPPIFNEQEEKYKIVNSDKLKACLDYNFIHPDPMKDL